METGVRREIELEGRTVEYLLRRSARARVLRAEISLRRGLRLTVPVAMAEGKGEAFLRSRGRWVVRALDRLTRLAARIPHRPLEHGTPVPYLGQDLLLDLNVGAPARVGRLGDSLIVHVPRRTPGAVRRALESWYRAEAGREFPRLVRELADRHHLRYSKVAVRGQKRRWGSCSSKGTLSFNWRLLLAPAPIVRYLVAHELAHLDHPDHSPRFWARLGFLCPAYRDHEKWLRRHGVGLVL